MLGRKKKPGENSAADYWKQIHPCRGQQHVEDHYHVGSHWAHIDPLVHTQLQERGSLLGEIYIQSIRASAMQRLCVHCPLVAALKTTWHCWCSGGVCAFHPRGPKAPGSPPGWFSGRGSPAQSATAHQGNSPGTRHLCWAEQPKNTTTHRPGNEKSFGSTELTSKYFREYKIEPNRTEYRKVQLPRVILALMLLTTDK